MTANFVTVDRLSPLLLPPDLRDWIPEDDLVHFVLGAVEALDLSCFHVNYRGSGSKQYPPHMMLGLLVYCYANGIFGSRRIERATYRDIAVRYLTGDTHPDHDTICTFRRENLEAVHSCFVKVLELARELKLLKVGAVSVDGTHLRASASKNKNVTYDRAGELSKQLEDEVQELLGKAEEADQSDSAEGQRLPEEIARREALKEKLEQARARLEERARKKAEAEQAEYQRKVKDREQRRGRAKGNKIKAPDDQPKGEKQINLVDQDSNLMRKSKRSGFEQSYNAQAVVDADGSQLVLGTRVSCCASDRQELAADIAGMAEGLETPQKVLADSGYASEEHVRELETQGIDVYVSTGAESRHQCRKHDLRPEHLRSETSKEPKAPWLVAMKAKLQTEEGKKVYRLRKQTVEPVFGIIKQAMGFRQFLLRGHRKVTGEWELVSLAYNMKRLWGLQATSS